MSKEVNIDEIKLAKQRVADQLPVTSLTRSIGFSELFNTNAFFKWDSLFTTGSFKERGACNFLHLLPADKRKQGVCAASAGNHALALSKYSALLDIPCTLVMPYGAPLVKIESAKAFGADVKLFGETFHHAYEHALTLSSDLGTTFVPAYDHIDIINGQGTAGLEILEQCPEVDCVVVPIGGGGLISGIATAIKALNPKVKIVGVKSEWALNQQQKPLAKPNQTIADGIAIKQVGKITQKIIDNSVDEILVVNEDQIADAIIKLLGLHRTIVEGAGAAGVAAFLANSQLAKYKNIVFHICGSNIDMNLLSRLIERDMVNSSRLIRLEVEVSDAPGNLNLLTSALASLGVNVLDVYHSRAFSTHPKRVIITIDAELRNQQHKEKVLAELSSQGYEISVLT